MEQLRPKIAKLETTLLQQIRHKKQQLDEARAMARTLDQMQSEAAEARTMVRTLDQLQSEAAGY